MGFHNIVALLHDLARTSGKFRLLARKRPVFGRPSTLNAPPLRHQPLGFGPEPYPKDMCEKCGLTRGRHSFYCTSFNSPPDRESEPHD